MPIDFPILKNFVPMQIKSVLSEIQKSASRESMELIIDSLMVEVRAGKYIGNLDLEILISWNRNLNSEDSLLLRSYISQGIGQWADYLSLVDSYFARLNQNDAVGFLLTCNFAALSEQQRFSFQRYLDSRLNSEDLSEKEVFIFVTNLYLIDSSTFTEAQKRIGHELIYKCDLSQSFESDFDDLVAFAESINKDNQYIAEACDFHLGKLLKTKEAEVTAKAFNPGLGFMKFMSFCDSNRGDLNFTKLPNLANLRLILSKFEEALEILSEEEAIRGTFWRSIVNRVDGIKFIKSRGRYRVAVAFYIDDFVFCDFGPTGNQIHIYDKSDFNRRILITLDWQKDSLLTTRLSTSKYPHVGTWQQKTLDLIREARRYA